MMKWKKMMATVVASSSMLLLAACTPSAQKINEKMEDAGQDVKNGRVEMTMDLKSGDEKIQVASDMDFKLKPALFRQELTLKGDGQTIPVTDYITDDEQYMKLNGEWIKGDKDTFKEVGVEWPDLEKEEKNRTYSAGSEKLLDEMEVNSKDDTYTMTLKGDSKNKKSVVKEVKKLMTSAVENEETKKLFKDIKVQSVDYTYKVDKDSYLPKNYQVKMKYKQDGETINAKMNYDYSKLNKNKDIKIPTQVKDAAIDLKDLNELAEMEDY